MSKTEWKPGNMLYPLPAVLVSCSADNKDNVLTIAWAGTVCTNPPMVTISVRPERYSYDMIRSSGEFVINLTTKELVRAVDYCGVKSGREVDKFKEMKLHKSKASKVGCPLIEESPVNIECKVVRVDDLGSHHMFLAEVVAVHVDDSYIDKNGKFHLSDAEPIVYSHGEYYSLGELLGSFGYSIRKKK